MQWRVSIVRTFQRASTKTSSPSKMLDEKAVQRTTVALFIKQEERDVRKSRTSYDDN